MRGHGRGSPRLQLRPASGLPLTLGIGNGGEITEACLGGARIATATSAQMAKLRAAAEPAYATLRGNRSQAATLTTLEALLEAVTPEAAAPVPAGCAYGAGEPIAAPAVVPVLTGPGRPGTFPKGTDRYVVTEKELRGIESEEWARANAGVWTWPLGAGRWSYVLKPSSKNVPTGYGGTTCEGYYDLRRDRISFTRTTVYAQGDCAPPTWSGQWTATKAGVKWSRMEIDGHDLDFLRRQGVGAHRLIAAGRDGRPQGESRRPPEGWKVLPPEGVAPGSVEGLNREG